MSHSPNPRLVLTIVALGLLAMGFGLFAATVVQADGADELANETIETTNDTEWIDIVLGFDGDQSANITIYETDEFEENGTDGEAVIDDVVEGENETKTVTYDVFHDDEYADGNLTTDETYRLLIEGDEDNTTVSVYLSDETSPVLIVDSDGSPGFGVAVAAVALLVSALMAARKRTGGEG